MPVRPVLAPVVVLAPLSLACTELEDAPVDGPWGGNEGGVLAEEVLTGTPEADFSERALLIAYGDLRFEPDGPVVLRGDDEPWPQELVVVDPGERVGVLVEAHSVQLLLYLDRIDLQPTTWGYAWAGPRPGSGQEGGLHLPPGVQVFPVASEAGGTWAEVDSGLLGTVELWLDDAAVDEVYLAQEEDEGWEPLDHESLVRLRGEVELLDAPSGHSLGTTRLLEGYGSEDASWVDAEVTGETRRGYVPVRLLDPLTSRGPARTAEVHAWVHEEDVVTEWSFGRSGGSSWGCGGCMGGWSSPAWVPAGTRVFDAEGGEVVGETTRRRAVGLPRDSRAWPALEVSTGWGELTVHVQPEDVEVREDLWWDRDDADAWDSGDEDTGDWID